MRIGTKFPRECVTTGERRGLHRYGVCMTVIIQTLHHREGIDMHLLDCSVHVALIIAVSVRVLIEVNLSQSFLVELMRNRIATIAIILDFPTIVVGIATRPCVCGISVQADRIRPPNAESGMRRINHSNVDDSINAIATICTSEFHIEGGWSGDLVDGPYNLVCLVAPLDRCAMLFVALYRPFVQHALVALVGNFIISPNNETVGASGNIGGNIQGCGHQFFDLMHIVIGRLTL